MTIRGCHEEGVLLGLSGGVRDAKCSVGLSLPVGIGGHLPQNADNIAERR